MMTDCGLDAAIMAVDGAADAAVGERPSPWQHGYWTRCLPNLADRARDRPEEPKPPDDPPFAAAPAAAQPRLHQRSARSVRRRNSPPRLPTVALPDAPPLTLETLVPMVRDVLRAAVAAASAPNRHQREH